MTEQTEPARDRLTIAAHRTVAGGTQIQIAQLGPDGIGIGYHLAGPKHHNQGTTELISRELDTDDAAEIRAMLDAVFPPKPPLTEAEREFLSFALELADDQVLDRGDEFTDEDRAALESLRRLATEGGAA